MIDNAFVSVDLISVVPEYDEEHGLRILALDRHHTQFV